MIGIARNALFALVACLICLEPLAAQAPAVIDAAPATGARIEAIAARHGMVAAQEARAARIGVEVLEQGGNAVDAAVATVPGTPMASAESWDLRGSASPRSSRKTSRVVAAGAVSR